MSEGLAEGNLKRNQDGSDEDRGQRQAADVSRFRAGHQVMPPLQERQGFWPSVDQHAQGSLILGKDAHSRANERRGFKLS